MILFNRIIFVEEFVSCSDTCFGNVLLESKVLKVRAQDLSLVHIFALSKLSVGSVGFQTGRSSRSHQIYRIKGSLSPVAIDS